VLVDERPNQLDVVVVIGFPRHWKVMFETKELMFQLASVSVWLVTA
jgi:hypothetical protein